MFELSFFIVLLLLVFTIGLYSLKIGISPMPSNKKVSYQVLEVLKEESGKKVYELGSGFGSLAVFLALNLPNKKIVAYEVSFIPWIISLMLKKVLKIANLKIYRKNFLYENLNDGILVCYLFPKGMVKLEEKIINEAIQTTIISNTFAFRKIVEKEVLIAGDFFKTPVFIYKDYSLRPKTAR